MTLYVESNVLLEIALGQEESREAEAILRAGEAGRVSLAVPIVAVSEPLSTVILRGRARRRAIVQIREQIRELARSDHTRAEHAALQPVPGLLAPIEALETRELSQITDRLLGCGRILQLDRPVFAQGVQLAARFSIAMLDALILARVLVDLANAPTGQTRYFVTKNKKDFDQSDVRQALAGHGCVLLMTFTDALAALPGP